jgi:galactose mutarotase-like enzyme
MIELGNGYWKARVAEKGAELKSLLCVETGTEHVWNGDPAWWNGSAPVLFPVIGGLKGGEYRYQGKSYKLPSHGFARTSDFAVVRADADYAEFRLASSEATREAYPFEFELFVSFALTRTGIDVRYRVRNAGGADMLFSIGSHPAFVVPFAGGTLENYYLLFDREEELERWFFKDGVIVAGKTAEVMENSRVINLDRRCFDDGIMIFKGPRSSVFSLVNGLNGRALRVVTEGVPYFGLWSKTGGAPFVCLEPWHGIPDMSDTSGELAEKEGIISLARGGEFATGYRVEVD